MRKIKSAEEVLTLKLGEQYIIELPDYNPEKLDYKLISSIHKKAEEFFSTEPKKDNSKPVGTNKIEVSPIIQVKDATYFAKTYTATKIKAVAKKLNLKATGTELSIAESILKVIPSEQFEILINN